MVRRLLALALLGLLLPTLPHGVGYADRLVPRGGKPLRGVVVEESGDEVVFNPYWSRHPDMVWGVVRLPRGRVKRLEIAPHPDVEVFRRLGATGPDDVPGLLEIAAFAKGHKRKAHARMCFALALAADPENVEALKGIGGRTKWASTRRGNPLLDPDLREALSAYVAEPDGKERERRARDLKKAGFPARPEALERYRRSASAPRGLLVDRPLSWASDLYPGASYTLFVPEGYDPVRTWPLLLGLHGGGADGKLGDEVVGSGRSAMNFYRALAAQHGTIVVCPNALEAPWGTRKNEGFVRALLEEMKHTYNVDLDRVTMTGHSMGGFGTWALGPRMAEDLAAISPMAGGGRGGIGELVKTRTPIFIYHSDNDYVSVESDRAAARQLCDTDLDFVYTELPGQGHGFPASIQKELFAFLEPRRRYDPGTKDVWPRSSLHGKVTKEEKRYLGDPLSSLRGEVESMDDLIDQLRVGGGRAAGAAQQLADAKPEGASAAVAKVLRDARASFDVRALAARTLGLLEDPAGARALRRAVAHEATRDSSRVAVEAARALALLQDPEAGGSLEAGIRAWTTYFEDRVVSKAMAFSDWQRCVPVLAELANAWAALPGKGDIRALASLLIDRVLGAEVGVETSERVPQDPSRARAALATACAKALTAWEADDEVWSRLLDAVRSDERARKAVEAAR